MKCQSPAKASNSKGLDIFEQLKSLTDDIFLFLCCSKKHFLTTTPKCVRTLHLLIRTPNTMASIVNHPLVIYAHILCCYRLCFMNNEEQSISQIAGKRIISLSQLLDEKSHHALYFHKMPKTFIEVFIGQLAMAHNERLQIAPGKETFGAITN